MLRLLLWGAVTATLLGAVLYVAVSNPGIFSSKETLTLAGLVKQKRVFEAYLKIETLSAAELKKELASLSPADMRTLVSAIKVLAESRLALDLTTSAARSAKLLVDIDGEKPENLLLFARCGREEGRKLDYRSMYEKVLKADPKNIEAYRELLKLVIADTDKMLEQLDRACKNVPDAEELFIETGSLLMDMGRLYDAREVYTRALAVCSKKSLLERSLKAVNIAIDERTKASAPVADTTTEEVEIVYVVQDDDDDVKGDGTVVSPSPGPRPTRKPAGSSTSTASYRGTFTWDTPVNEMDPEDVRKLLRKLRPGIDKETLLNTIGYPKDKFKSRSSGGPWRISTAERWKYLDNSGVSGFYIYFRQDKIAYFAPFRQ